MIKELSNSVCLMAVLLFCIGCTTSTPTSNNSGPESRSLAELTHSLMAEVEEIKFCLSEDAGVEALRESADRLKKILDAMPGSASASGLSATKMANLNSSIQALTTTHGSLVSSLDSQASPKEISKVNSKMSSEIKKLSKIAK